jgi:hypothetical protein
MVNGSILEIEPDGEAVTPSELKVQDSPRKPVRVKEFKIKIHETGDVSSVSNSEEERIVTREKKVMLTTTEKFIQEKVLTDESYTL